MKKLLLGVAFAALMSSSALAAKVGVSMAIVGSLGAIGGACALWFGMNALRDCLRADSDIRSASINPNSPLPA